MTNFQVVHDGRFGFPFYYAVFLALMIWWHQFFLMDKISALECFPPNYYRWFLSAMKLPV